MLTPLGDSIWIAEGPVVPFLHFPYPTRMVVIRLKDGALFVWSPIAFNDALRAEIDTLGPVAHLVSPNAIHHLFLGEWKAAYPAARLYASPGLPKRRRDLHFDAVLSDTPESAWVTDIDQVAMRGSFVMTEIVFLHHASRTVIFADLIQNFRLDWFKGWRGVLARLDGIVGLPGGAPREWRATFWRRDQALARILAFGPRQVVVAHGEIVRENGTEFVRKAFRWLSR
ncbi:MAG: DUF4336 domain-containing protein [Alphaproteobacteria bacterium]|nr:DUF4336 domain-containing protein [Alphaproteobacteria bacterium]MDE2110033.1 DUF4336 domain-containing protein [Alphaproteobacteria bacterium]MDE2492965.1 DUF4336 domain-containing protein [Alphaproteobacteria bacterium]